MGLPWRIEVLGDLCARRDEQVIDRFRTQKTGLLLAYLALNKQRVHPRDELGELFWPEHDGTAKRVQLSQALWSLRKELEGAGDEPIFIADRNSIRLNQEGLVTDVEMFEKLLDDASRLKNPQTKKGHLQSALQVYRGDLLPGHHDDWVFVLRERLAYEHTEALISCLDLCFQEKAFEEGIRYAQKLLSIDRLQESVHCQLMRAYLELGRIDAALQQYEQLAHEFSDALGVEPGEEAKQLLQEARKAAKSKSVKPVVVMSHGDAQRDYEPPCNLPPQFTRFFWRKNEMDKVKGLLTTDGNRLITLFGAGGCGKTRLGIEVAKQSKDYFSGGMWFVHLADITDGNKVGEAVLQALELDPNDSDAPLKQSIRALQAYEQEGPVLLVLDNVEHVAESAAASVKELLCKVQSLVCMLTSRQRLWLDGEREYPVLPFETPAPDSSTEELLEFESIRMFIDRAQAVHSSFELTPQNAQVIAELCAKLDGIPLAIELAAAWAQALSPQQMLTQLSDRFELLVSRRKDINSRHHSLRATVDYSYDQLPKELQRFFVRLSVFQGGWTQSSAQAVCDPDLNDLEIRDYLVQLRERSLILSDDKTGPDHEMRYRMLETLREYAIEKLQQEDEVGLVRKRHANYFKMKALAGGTAPAQWLQAIGTERENIRTALRWSVENGEVEIGLIIATALRRYWGVGGLLTEGQNILLELLRTPGADQIESSLKGTAFSCLGSLAWRQGNYQDAREHFTKALHIFEKIGDQVSITSQLCSLGIVAFLDSDFATANQVLERGLKLARETRDTNAQATILNNLGNTAWAQAQYERAREFLEESLHVHSKDNNDLIGLGSVFTNLGNVACFQGDYEAAEQFTYEALRIQEQIDNQEGKVTILLNLGIILSRKGEFESAYHYLLQSIKKAYELNLRRSGYEVLRELARVSIGLEDVIRGIKLLAASETLCKEITSTMSPVDQLEFDSIYSLISEVVSEETLQKVWAEGAKLSWDEAFHFANDLRRTA